METDDKLIKEFFGQHREEIPDNGFSRRVMRQLPDRRSRWSGLWTGFVGLIAILIFVRLDGLQAMVASLRDALVAIVQSGANNFDPRTLILVVVVLGFFGVRKVYSLI